ncbi:MAG: sensor domain-containing diguanylate cyclase [Aliarcobacter skirrowii]|nr:sensor domain-containing diguanylate cyclase [Aliarcobacter skirrowii]
MQAALENNFLLYKNSLLEQEKTQVKTNVEIAIQIYKNQIILAGNKNILNSSFLNLMKNINSKASDYFFIFDTSGNVILHSFLNFLEGENLFILEDENYNSAVKTITTNYQNDRFVNYLWLNPNTNKVEEKVSFLKLIPETNLIIGSGFYPSEIEKKVEEKIKSEEATYDKNIYLTLLLALIFIVLSIFIAFFVSNILLKKFNYLAKSKNLNEEQASIDNMTKLYNRDWFYKALETFHQNLKDDKNIFSLVVFDIDDIKNINTTFNYDFGDTIIKQIANLAKATLPKDVFISRVAGDRFAIIIPQSDLNSSFILAKKLKNNVEGHIFKNDQRVTISLGVIEANKNISSHELIRKVDLALFKAKKEGKNRVIAYKS